MGLRLGEQVSCAGAPPPGSGYLLEVGQAAHVAAAVAAFDVELFEEPGFGRGGDGFLPRGVAVVDAELEVAVGS